VRIDSVDFFYLAMPVVTDEGDGSQDALLVRVTSGGHFGWGECEASPLVSIAAFVTPMSHGACRPVSAAVLGKDVSTPEDIALIAAEIGWNSMDLLQAPHTWSGVEMALWDLLGRARGEPVWRMLGYQRAEPKTPYASALFGDEPQVTLQRGLAARQAGFRAAKFGWGPIGRGTVADDANQFFAAREGLGPDGILLIDAGQIWGQDIEAAAARLPALEQVAAVWLEEPFGGEAVGAYRALSARSPVVRLAGGEASHNEAMAYRLMDDGGIGFVQIDCGRVGGIGPAYKIAQHAEASGITYVNHTFTSHLALSASIQPFAGLVKHEICEYPFAPKPLARDLTTTRMVPDASGHITAPDAPGLGLEISGETVERYLVDAEIKVGGKTIYSSPKF
jgi:L-alanine-DL-glutamate epimerase-like enolase superfamily enzyme